MLPKNFVDDYKSHGADSSMYGVKIETLSRDELLATIGFLSKELERSRSTHKEDFEFIESLACVRRRV